ncbi:hypothetical protein JTB14_038054 [Gonioctena quinquepunctata]|nr:hypothetical protein JTB14_038054 [Gonioctena quinquepunctata]
MNFSKEFTDVKIFEKLRNKNDQVDEKGSVRSLEVERDKRMTMHKHIILALQRESAEIKRIYPLNARSPKLFTENKCFIYKHIIGPVLTYTCPVFCSLPKYQFTRLERFQNEALRIFTTRDRYTRWNDFHKLAGIETISEFIRKISTTFYKFHITRSELKK